MKWNTFQYSSKRYLNISHFKQAGNRPNGFALKFLKYAKDTTFKLLPFSQWRKIPQSIRIRLTNHFFPNWKHTKFIFEKNVNFFLKRPIESKKVSARITTFSHAEISHGKKGIRFEEMKVSERRTLLRRLKKDIFHDH